MNKTHYLAWYLSFKTLLVNNIPSSLL